MLGQPVFGADGGCYDKLPVVSVNKVPHSILMGYAL